MKFKTSTTIYRIIADENSDSYKVSAAEVEVGRIKTPIWNKIRVSDWHIDRCFLDISDRLGNVPDRIIISEKYIDMPHAQITLKMPQDDLRILLRKDLNEQGNPLIYLECSKPSSIFNKRLPDYLSEIIDNYKATKVSP